MDETFVSSFSRAMNTPIPDDGNSVDDVRPFGWAPGEYFCRACSDCGEGYCGDKRCRRCRACAVKAMEAYRNRPTWQSGHKGIPTDRPVWAYFYEGGSTEGDDVTLVRGVAKLDGDVFTVDDDGGSDLYGHVVSWIDVEERPVLSVEAVDAIVVAIAEAGIHWSCADHIVEDWLHRFALRAVADGHREAPAIAAAALKTRELTFSRYCG